MNARIFECSFVWKSQKPGGDVAATPFLVGSSLHEFHEAERSGQASVMALGEATCSSRTISLLAKQQVQGNVVPMAFWLPPSRALPLLSSCSCIFMFDCVSKIRLGRATCSRPFFAGCWFDRLRP